MKKNCRAKDGKVVFGAARIFQGLCCAILFACGATARAETFQFYQTASIPTLGIASYAGVSSLRIRDNLLNGASNANMFMGDSGNDADNRCLLRFNFSALSGWTVVSDGTLQLTVNQVDGSPGIDDFFDLHLIYPTNAEWTTANSTWNWLSITPASAWKNALGADLPTGTGTDGIPNTLLGGLGNPGDGYEAAPIATINRASYAVSDVLTATIPAAAIQTLISDGAAPRGILFRLRDEDNFGRIQVMNASSGAAGPNLTFNAEPASGIADWKAY
ncbi:MAG: hypothetical protein BWZ10_00334 [candidate division BRC1 bacterium ADurb.BinA364]|nr:MAG: hypothetical protein BWZ10_00334 [candidate division BRC1 bacterium ADurb.BinA364]